jgi:polar amino acid transport system substrate-binding protein
MKNRMKLLVTAVAVLSIAVFALAGCSSQSGSSASSNNAGSGAADSKTLVVGFDSAYPPYGFVGNDGTYTGFDLDLAQAVCDRNGWTFKAEPIDWDAKDSLLNQGTVNCLWNGFTMEGREGKYTFSEPYMLNEQVVVVKANSGISNLSDLAGKTVMTQVDSAALEVLTEPTAEGGQADLTATFAGGAAQTIADYNNAFMQMQSGVVDAVACDLSIAQYQMAANPGTYIMLDTPLSQEHYAVAFKTGDTATADAVTATLKELYEDGTVAQLCDKYAEYGMSYDNWVLK